MKSDLPVVHKVSDIRLGRNVSFDAWWYTFMAENNLEHSINPEGVASPEQLRFMVALEPEQIHTPCRDEIFQALLEYARTGALPLVLRKAYGGAWKLAIGTILRLTRNDTDNGAKRRRMLHFCRHRLRNSLALGNILPSRLVKRLLTTILNLNQHDDPWAASKQADNAAMAALLASPAWRAVTRQLPAGLEKQADMPGLRHALDMAELARLFLLSIHSRPYLPAAWASPEAFCAKAQGFIPALTAVFGQGKEDCPDPKTLMFVCDSEGGIVADLELLKALVRQGHRVVLALKSLPLFTATTFWECETDPVLSEAMRGLPRIASPRLSKNDLLRELSLHHFIVINDGTGELLNLYRTSVTFARAWKECDAIIVKGRRQSEQMINMSSAFTRDILCCWRDEDEGVHMRHIPRAEGVPRFSEADLISHADAIITSMSQARAEGKTVMFYSCMIGSLPGEVDTAIRVATEFVRYLRSRLDQVLIINPAEHFVQGMDADDLMFMWERVQRSGLIQTWRFQTTDDIETSFSLMDLKVPPIWTGKDATYSTGCTKEMRIALDMQRTHPEMQILGPAMDKFFRRGEYGVGKFHDAALDA